MRTILSLLLIPARRLFRDGVLGSVPVYLAAIGLAVSPSVLAQEEDEEQEDEQPIVQAAADEVEEVVVTGSRLKRDTYSSITPLQIITAEVSREAGIIDASEIVQKSSVSAGQQIDVTFSGYVLDDGPGTQTANLRGLGSARTLLLVNGRRLAPGGVEGAPSSPDLSLIPGTLVQQYDLLLDGASSIYGSDAIAGVANIILRKDFDGLEIETLPSRPHHDGGDNDVLSVVWGKNFDRGFIGVGSEYYKSEPVTYADRPWTAGCSKHIEVDEGGTVRVGHDLYYQELYGMDMRGCGSIFPLSSRVSVPLRGSLYYTPGYSNGGWPSFSESETYGFPVDGDGDGEPDVNYRDYSLNGERDYAELYGGAEVLNVLTFGEYTFEGEMNLTPFFEMGYVEHQYANIGDEAQLFPFVPARNPFNLCNPEAVGGVDCGMANDALLDNPNYVAQFINRWGAPPQWFPFLFNPSGIGPQETIPIVTVRGDRADVFRYLEQYRYVVGIGGDLPMLNVGSLSDWSFELAYVHMRSDGTTRRPGIREDRLDFALGRYSTSNTPCHNDTQTPMAFDAAPGCVPINMFARSLYSSLVGDFATQAERDYVFDDRDFATEYRQTIVTYYMTGTLFELPAGGVAAGIGAEYRDDQITSVPDHVARDGLFWGFFADGGAKGQKDIKEVFGEIELPILADRFAATELTMNLSARWTKDQYGGSAWTGSAKLGYRPIDSLLLRATGGTSFRAPNLRELFLQDQTGFLTVFDPCLIPESALDDISGVYDSALDDRDPIVLENCLANGVDPRVAHNNGFNSYSVEVAAGGALDLKEETSESITAGFAWEQPFTTAFDLTIGASYYRIEIDNTIIEPSAGFIVYNCYNSETGTSPFCHRITRGEVTANGTGPFISYLDRGFINRDNETARGVDFNVAFDTTFTAFDRPFELGVDINAHRVIERSTLFVDDEGVPDFNEFQREWYFAEYRGSATARVDYDRWRFSWTTRYVSPGERDPFWVEPFSDYNDTQGTGYYGETCSGPPDDLYCRNVGDTPSYKVHAASLRYAGDVWGVRLGASNIFDEGPPLVEAGEYATTIKNAPIGAGYDFDGRTWFLSAFVRLFQGE